MPAPARDESWTTAIGFTVADVVTQQVVLPQSRFDRAAQVRFYQAVLDRLAQDPRVAAASVVFPTPLVDGKASATVHVDRASAGIAADRDYAVRLGSIASGYFAALRMPLVAGRDFTPADYPESANTVIVNQSLARELLGEEAPIGRRLRFGDGEFQRQGDGAPEPAPEDDDAVRGVAIVGRPVARMLDDGATVEILRVCTDGARNACSMLYGAARRTARSLGYTRIVTYTLPEEGGASLRAAGFRCEGAAGDTSRGWHNRPGRTVGPVGDDLVGGKLRWVA